MGWFNGNAVYLNPLTAKARADKMTDLVGISKLVQNAKAAYKNKDYQWALELSEHVLLVDRGNSEARKVKIDSLMSLGSRQISRNGRNYYMTAAFEEASEITLKGGHEDKNKDMALKSFPIRVMIDALPVNFKPEECDSVNKNYRSGYI